MTKPFVLLIILLALASLSYADSPSILYFDSVSGTYGGHSYAAESYYGPYYVSPYFGHVDNSPVGSEVLFCIILAAAMAQFAASRSRRST